MPRQPRLDIPDMLYHVIVRGIDRTPIFLDDTDRQNFLDRFSNLLAQTGTECYAWALIPNHFHLLLRPRQTSLSSFMRRLLTGHAVNFNRRHKRSGHLFQNRYKSILCEEDTYLLELLRYIHLNPLRAGLVPDLQALDTYPWCGHAELLGSRPALTVATEAVHLLFREKQNAARKAYHQYVAEGLDMGKRPEFSGGGLRRSMASSQESTDYQDYDERVLGSGNFVDNLRQEGLLDLPLSPQMELSKLQEIIENHCQLSAGDLFRRGRLNAVAEARELFCFCAVRWQGHTATAVGIQLGVGVSSVTRSVRRGERRVRENPIIHAALETKLKQ